MGSDVSGMQSMKIALCTICVKGMMRLPLQIIPILKGSLLYVWIRIFHPEFMKRRCRLSHAHKPKRLPLGGVGRYFFLVREDAGNNTIGLALEKGLVFQERGVQFIGHIAELHKNGGHARAHEHMERG